TARSVKSVWECHAPFAVLVSVTARLARPLQRLGTFQELPVLNLAIDEELCWYLNLIDEYVTERPERSAIVRLNFRREDASSDRVTSLGERGKRNIMVEVVSHLYEVSGNRQLRSEHTLQ